MAMMRGVRCKSVVLCSVATVLIATPVSVAIQAETSGAFDLATTQTPTSGAGDIVFADGFETGSTSMWSNGENTSVCQATLQMPTELAD